eukprot:Hpha_TRINITY_DN2169_c0_g1::TRINITY_DN2169_c0_g1_i1::g.42367::m.42367
MLREACKVVSALCVLCVMLLVGMFTTKQGRYQFFKLQTQLRMLGDGSLDAPMHRATQVSLIGTIIACGGDYGVCGRAEIGGFLSRLAGWEGGKGPGFLQFAEVVVSHEEYVKMIYDTKFQRSKDIFISGNITTIVPGYVPLDTFLQLATDSPERVSRRALMSEAIGALKRHPTRPALSVPSFVTPEGRRNDSQVAGLTGKSLFQWMFGVDLSDSDVEMLAEYNSLTGGVALGLSQGSEEGATRVKEIYARVQSLLRDSEIGRGFLKQAEERGMNPDARLEELVGVVLFAGYGGTSAFTTSTIRRINRDPSLYVPMYLKNKAAFLKESARLEPPVGGLVYVSGSTHTNKYGGDLKGWSSEVKKGDLAVAWIPTANKDPRVFGGRAKSEAYAYQFDPTRENLDQIMTWNGLLQDIENGHAPPGTPGHAPRACPGAIFALQLCEKVVDYFLPKVGSGTGGRDEL